MVERPHDGPLPPAHPVPYGRLPQPDGQTVPQPSRRLPLVTGQFVAGCVCAALVLVLAAAGIAGWLP